jgi:fructokinase
MTKRVVVGLGEVLWDIFPSGKLLGGAPANFAYMVNVLGDEGIVASRLGNDALGREAFRVMNGLGLNTAYLQTDGMHETGTAGVSVDRGGQPTFAITESAAWDFLQWTQEWEELSSRADVVCFGSLAQRSIQSAATIESFLQATTSSALRICDANLREPFYSADVLRKSFQWAHVVKLNDQELLQVSSLLHLGAGSQETLMKRMLDEFGLRIVCVTRGSRGSLLMSQTQTVRDDGYRVNVADTIGAGDAFTACLAHYYLRGDSLEHLSVMANRFASWVATQNGATPSISSDQLQDILNGAHIPKHQDLNI